MTKRWIPIRETPLAGGISSSIERNDSVQLVVAIRPAPVVLDRLARVSAHPEQPRIVAQALLLSRSRGFIASCRVETGRLLATLAASRTGTLAEIGTGCGVGAAWIYSSMRPEAKLVTAEVDQELAGEVGKLFADDDRVTVLAADWRELTKAAPFSLLFFDSREPKKAGPDGVVDFLEPGGIAVLDDFTPTTTWPPMYNGSVDVLRQSWLTDPRFATSDVMVTDDACVLVATKL